MFSRISTFSGPMQLNHAVQSLQSQINQLTAEVSSGQKQNPAQSMGPNAALLYQLQVQADQQTALQTAATTSAQRMDTIQTALSGIASVLQGVVTSAQSWGSGLSPGLTIAGQEGSSALGQILGQLNTSFAGTAVFAGDTGTAPPMQASGASGGPVAALNAILTAAVAAKGGTPLSAADVDTLVSGADGLSSVFDDSNSNPALRYRGAFYTGSTDGKPTKVLVSPGHTLQYDASADQKTFRDVLQGLSMLSLLSAPSDQMDDTAKSALLAKASQKLGEGQRELTNLQGMLGATQAQVEQAAQLQQTASDATQAQILSYVQADTYGASSRLVTLQTQLQASYALTARLSQLSLVQYMGG